MRIVLVAGLVLAAVSGRAFGCDATLAEHVRIVDCRLAAAVASAIDRSPTLEELLARVERTDGIIYVTPPPIVGPATRLLGGLSHDVTTAGRYRVLRIFVSAGHGDRAVATVGHELQHALELLEMSAASNRAEADALFDRLGWRSATDVVETQAALNAGYAIERELRRRKAAESTQRSRRGRSTTAARTSMPGPAGPGVHRSSVIGPRRSAIGHRPSAIGHRSSVIGPRRSAVGHRPSAIGHRHL